MNRSRLLLGILGFICLVFQTPLSFAQGMGTIKGTVVDAKGGNPLSGATIIQVGGDASAVANSKGGFEIKVPDNAVLEISMTGYETKKVKASQVVRIALLMNNADLEGVVVIGYGTQKKANLTSAVSSINASEIANIPTSSLSNVLAGRLSGTFVRSSTGTPGISSDVRIRSMSSWNGGSPVYVIDGIVRDKISFDALDPNEVAEVTVLKDAASAAIYGSRSSNGVVLITTKSGRKGRVDINVSAIAGTERTGKMPEYMEVGKALDYAAAVNGGISQEEKDWVLKNNPKGENYYNAAYQNPNNQRYALSSSGGTDIVNYFIGGSYYNENGFLPTVWFKKYNLRANVNAKLTKDLSVTLNLNNNSGTRNRFNFTYDYGSADLNNLWGKLLYWNVWDRPYIDGKPVNPGWLGNVVEMMKSGGYWRANNQQMDALLSVEYKVPFIPGLSARASYSKNINNNFVKNFAQKQVLYDFKKTGANSLIYTDELVGQTKSGDPGSEYIGNEYYKSNSYQLNAQVSYDKKFGEHNLSATGVYEQSEGNYNNFSMYRYNFPLFPTDQFFAASANNSDWSTGGSESQDARVSYVGRVNYDYAGKYLFSSSIRYDGSIKFAPDKRWGLFPSASAGWVISKENFFSKASRLNFVDFLKARFSYGTTGNDAIGGWQWQDQFAIQGGTYYLGQNGTTAPRLAYNGTPNPDLTWETSKSYNLGLDIAMFKRFSFTMELWKRHTYDILGPRILVLPAEYGGSFPATNYGEVDSKGIELELGYGKTIGKNFQFNVKGNFGFSTNKVVLRDAAQNAQQVDNPNGKTLSYGAGYQATGIIRNQSDLSKLPADYKIFGATPELGMMNFADLSGAAGTPDGTIDSYDRIVLGQYFGSNNAPITFGLNGFVAFKGFSLDMLFAGLAGFKNSYNDPWGRNFGGGGKIPTYHDNAWSENNPGGTTPKLYPWGDARSNGYTQTSTFNIYDGSFFRLKYLNLGYDLPARWMNKANIKGVKVFASGNNLFCVTGFKFYDPEISQFMSYPIMKAFTLGIDVKL